jgi:1-acyl-sn-glycerol-3-phosphate acyltransferase
LHPLKFVKSLLLKLYVVWVLFVFSFFMILFLPFFLFPPLFGDKTVSITYFFLKAWSWIFSKLNIIPYKIINRKNIKRGKSYIYTSNHTSFLDIPGITMTIKGQFRPLAKKELKKLPVFGWIAQAASVIVDRSSNESRRKSMEHLKKVLELNISILIFPEGTQNRTPELLQPFYDGAFRIAIETQRPIMPLVVIGAGSLMPPGKFFIQPGRIKIVVGQEVPTQGMQLKDVTQLKEQVQKQMLELFHQHLTL